MEAQLKLIGLDDIDINEANPRKAIDEKSLEQLAASVASVGIIQPVVITTRDGRNLLVTGERRVRAARMAGLEEIPAVVRDLTDKEILEAMLVENLQREDLLPLEEADTLKLLTKEHGWRQQDLAKHIGRSQAWVSRRIALLALPQEAQDALYAGVIKLEDGFELLRLRKHPKRLLDVMDRYKKWGVKTGVDRACREIAEGIAKEIAYKKLEAEGKRVWKERFEYWYSAVPGPEQAMLLNEKEEKKHQKEGRECLAYAVHWNDEPRPVCTDREHWVPAHEEKHGADLARARAERDAVLGAKQEVIRSITGSVEEIEERMRREALACADNVEVCKTAARAFGWKDGRRLDKGRLRKEIEGAKRRELRRIWLVSVACHQLATGWGRGDVIEMIKEMRKEA